jgi:hypothetical protein
MHLIGHVLGATRGTDLATLILAHSEKNHLEVRFYFVEFFDTIEAHRTMIFQSHHFSEDKLKTKP